MKLGPRREEFSIRIRRLDGVSSRDGKEKRLGLVRGAKFARGSAVFSSKAAVRLAVLNLGRVRICTGPNTNRGGGKASHAPTIHFLLSSRGRHRSFQCLNQIRIVESGAVSYGSERYVIDRCCEFKRLASRGQRLGIVRCEIRQAFGRKIV